MIPVAINFTTDTVVESGNHIRTSNGNIFTCSQQFFMSGI